MASKHICKKCGNDTFSVIAHVAQEWEVNERGDWIETLKDCTDIVHAPADDDVWACTKCGSDETVCLAENEFPVIILQADKERLERLMNQIHVDYGKEGIIRFSTVKSWTAKCYNEFGPEYEADLKVCSGDDGDPLWCECVLFLNGSEVACSEVESSLEQKWEFKTEEGPVCVVPVFVK